MINPIAMKKKDVTWKEFFGLLREDGETIGGMFDLSFYCLGSLELCLHPNDEYPMLTIPLSSVYQIRLFNLGPKSAPPGQPPSELNIWRICRPCWAIDFIRGSKPPSLIFNTDTETER